MRNYILGLTCLVCMTFALMGCSKVSEETTTEETTKTEAASTIGDNTAPMVIPNASYDHDGYKDTTSDLKGNYINDDGDIAIFDGKGSMTTLGEDNDQIDITYNFYTSKDGKEQVLSIKQGDLSTTFKVTKGKSAGSLIFTDENGDNYNWIPYTEDMTTKDTSLQSIDD